MFTCVALLRLSAQPLSLEHPYLLTLLSLLVKHVHIGVGMLTANTECHTGSSSGVYILDPRGKHVFYKQTLEQTKEQTDK